jgi:hypothetical protein
VCTFWQLRRVRTNFLRQLVIKEIWVFEPLDTIDVGYQRGIIIIFDEDDRKSKAYHYIPHLPC